MNADPLAWRPLSVVARDIGISERTLRNWIARESAPLIAKQIAGKPHLQATVAYDYALTKSGKAIPGLHEPAGYESAPAKTSSATSENSGADAGRAAGTVDPHSVLQGFIDTLGEDTSPALIQAIRGCVAELRAKRESDAKAATAVKREDVIDMLSDQRALLAETADDCAAADGIELVRFIRTTFDVDLAGRNISAPRLIEVFLRERSNRMLSIVNEKVAEQIKGVQALVFAPQERTDGIAPG